MNTHLRHTTPQPITVLIADDHPSVRAGLRLLLETTEDLEVVAEASDGGSAVRQTAEFAPDVVLMDARMPGIDGIEATRQIAQGHPRRPTDSTAVTAGGTYPPDSGDRLSRPLAGPASLPRSEVLMLTTFDLDEVVFGALRAGAAGFLLKSAEPARLIEAIRQVAAGDGVVAPEVTRRLLDAFAAVPAPQCPDDSFRDATPDAGPKTSGSPPPNSADFAALLTPRELDVFAALGRGLSNAEVASELFISLATVKTHVSAVLSKLHLSSRMQAAIRAREAGLAE